MTPSLLADCAALYWRHPRASREAILRYRDARIRAVVAHAAARVPYYRELFRRHGIDPAAIRGAADLPALPSSTKRDFLDAGPGLLTEGLDPAGLASASTSGSSGEPFTIRRAKNESRRLRVLRLRAYRLQGFRLSDRVVQLGTPRARPAGRSRIRALDTLRNRWAVVDTFLPTDRMLNAVAAAQPDVLGGYPGSLAELADGYRVSGRRDIQPRLIATGAEVLTPDARRRIETAFGAPVLETYGTTELNLLAWECPRTGSLHVCDDGVVLEVIRPDGSPAAPGEEGEVVATSLHCHAMPFIRYRLGDVVTRGAEQCSCGAPFSVIGTVQGRAIDYFRLPDGRAVNPSRLVGHLARGERRWVRRYQMVQEAPGRIVLRVVPAEPPVAQEVERLGAEVRSLAGNQVDVHVQLVDSLGLEPSGKFRLFRSLAASAGGRP